MYRRDLLRNAALLLGGAVSASVVPAVLAGVETDISVENPVFDESQRKQCAVLSELIIPETDTPGAIEAGVPAFIELMVSDWYTDTERDIFFTGLNALDGYCVSSFGQSFLQCKEQQQIAALEQAEKDAKDYQADTSPFGGEDENKPFFHKIRELAVLGYYTSEVGAKQELSYLPMPMRYEDIDLAEVGRQWSS